MYNSSRGRNMCKKCTIKRAPTFVAYGGILIILDKRLFRTMRFDSRSYQIFWEVVGLERGPLSLESTIEELLESKSSGCGLEIREYDRGDPSRWPRDTFYPQKLALTLPTSGGRSVGIVRSRTKATEFFMRLNMLCTRYLVKKTSIRDRSN
jgi:hypothetical protein